MFYKYLGHKSPSEKTWRDKLQELKAARAEFEQNQHGMSDYERKTISEALTQQKEQVLPDIEAGILAEFDASIEAYQAAEQQVNRQKMREIERWNPARLRDEMQVFEMQIDQAIGAGGGHPDGVSEALETVQALYNEAKASGDDHKQRAALQVIRGALGKFTEAPMEYRTEVNRMGRHAGRELEGLRTTPELQQAKEDAAAAYFTMLSTHDELKQIEQDVGSNHTLFVASMRLTGDPDTGQVVIKPKRPPRPKQTIEGMMSHD